MGTLARAAIRRQEGRVDHQDECQANTGNKGADQQLQRLTKQDLPGGRQPDEQVRAYEDGFAAEAIDTQPGRENGHTSANRPGKKHDTNKISFITQRGQVQVIQDEQDAGRHPAQGIIDEIQAGIALKTSELAKILND